MSTRSIQPVFWLLFGAGGMVSALIGAAFVLVTGIALPLGLLAPQGAPTYDAVLAFCQHWAGKAFVFAIVFLFLWHGAHRAFHCLHDLGIHAKKASMFACYGIAALGTLAAAVSLIRIGF
jgi:fumarate reductase subunit D